MCLVATAPAEAGRRQDPDGSEQKIRAARKGQIADVTRLSDTVILSGIVRAPRSGDTGKMLRRDRRVQMAGDPLLGLDGLPVMTNGMVGRLPILDRVDVGLGLFTVTGASTRERELRKTDPIRDVAPRTSRLAGAGLRVNF
ncbi:hypothetical protein [Sphingosinicella sp. BN140058]|uniref:hypothetical protein n=1 Tax=Sphingosinicella sp. BN140058 TaxID=1892855 RepID=UPI001012E3F9|nr:hypothetical protein [Sphingosinicella sp. BN140058]QAY76939.1 hypothetical protein ETR14_10860 [Sphingosinicella sp. BN140058]